MEPLSTAAVVEKAERRRRRKRHAARQKKKEHRIQDEIKWNRKKKAEPGTRLHRVAQHGYFISIPTHTRGGRSTKTAEERKHGEVNKQRPRLSERPRLTARTGRRETARDKAKKRVGRPCDRGCGAPETRSGHACPRHECFHCYESLSLAVMETTDQLPLRASGRGRGEGRNGVR